MIPTLALALALSAPPPPGPAPASDTVALVAALESCQDMDCPAFRALVARGDDAWPALDQGLTDPKELTRFWSIGVLAEHPIAAARPRLLAFTADTLVRIRAAACFALAAYPGPDVTAALVKALSDFDPNVRFEATSALGRRAPDPTAVDALVKLLDDQDEDVRAAAAETLGLQGAHAKTTPVAKALLATLSDRKPAVRGRVAIALGQLAVADATPPLIKRLERERDPEALAAAAWALGELASPTARAPLEKLLAHASEVVRQHATDALAKLPASPPPSPK